MTGTTATTAQPGDQPNPRTTAIRQGRQADSARRRQRVIAVLARAHTDGTEISAAGIARAAGVDRSFLYRHRDLLAAGDRTQRLNSRIRQLEKRLSETLGEKAWQESGLGVPADIDNLNQTISHLEQQVIDLRRLQLDERDQDLTAARAANRELIAQLNTATRHR